MIFFSYELIAYKRFYFSPYSAYSIPIFHACNHAKKCKIAFAARCILNQTIADFFNAYAYYINSTFYYLFFS